MKDKTVHLNCKICGAAPVEYITELPLTTSAGKIDCEITRCPACGSYSRSVDFSTAAVRDHFNSASYAEPGFEQLFLEGKKQYFRYLLQLLKKVMNKPLNNLQCLDIGPSYGHMLDIFKAGGVNVEGVEIVDNLREKLKARGYQIYADLDSIPKSKIFDMVTFIDSLYYLEDPVKALLQVKSHLQGQGILVLRIPNRTPFLNLALKLGRPVTNSLFLDAKHNFSYLGMKKLCERTGYQIDKIVFREKGKKAIISYRGKRMSLSKRIYGSLSQFLCSIAGRKIGALISPGFILFCRPIQSSGGQS